MKKIFLINALIVIATFTNAQVTNGLVAKYSFNNGNADDEAGSNNGIINGATLTTDRFGCPNKAFSFNAPNSDLITIPNNPAIDFTNTDDFSIAFWLKVSSVYSAGAFLFIKQNSGSWNGYWFCVNNNDAGYCHGPGAFSFYAAAGANHDACADSLISNDTLHWNFVTGVYKGSTNHTYLYVNGILQSDSGYSSGSVSNSADLFLGGHPNLGFFNGKMDDIRIYNRTLNVLEIDTLFHEASPCSDNTENILTHNTISVYPNPVENTCNLFLNKHFNQTVLLEIFNVYGQLMTYKSFSENNKNITVDLSLLHSGFYYIRLSSGIEKSFIKILKN